VDNNTVSYYMYKLYISPKQEKHALHIISEQMWTLQNMWMH